MAGRECLMIEGSMFEAGRPARRSWQRGRLVRSPLPTSPAAGEGGRAGERPRSQEGAAPSRLIVIRIHQFETRPALELAGRGFAGGRIDVALARLAQEAGFHKEIALGRSLLAALL